jgi:hypothetical protein
LKAHVRRFKTNRKNSDYHIDRNTPAKVLQAFAEERYTNDTEKITDPENVSKLGGTHQNLY